MKIDALYEIPILWIEVLFFPGTFRRQKGGIRNPRLAISSVVIASVISAILDAIWYSIMSVQTRFDIIVNFVLYIGKNMVTLVCLWLVFALFINMFAKFLGGRGNMRTLTFTLSFVCSAFQIALSVLFLMTAFTTREGAILLSNFVFFVWLGIITSQAIEIQYKLKKIQAVIAVLLSLAVIWFFYFLLFDIIYLSPWLPYY
jgi:hypothetical protein